MNKVFPLCEYNQKFNQYLPTPFEQDSIYQSEGLSVHIAKRHPEALKYIDRITEIIHAPDYIGINPREKHPSFELVKVFEDNIQIGIKLDMENGYLFVATLHPITTAKLQHRCKSGRLHFRNSETDSRTDMQELEANVFARNILMPAAVLAALDIHTPEEIATLCDVSPQSAAIRAARLEKLYQRHKFGQHPLERQVLSNFEHFIENYKKS